MVELIIEVAEQMICLMLIMGLMFAYARKAYADKGRKIFYIGVIAGIAAGAVMSYMKNGTNKIDTSYWNYRIFIITLIAFAGILVFTNLEKKLGKLPSAVCLAVEAFMLLFYVLPDFIAYPFSVYVAETTVFSSSYIIKLGGVVIGFILTLVAAFAANRMGARFKQKNLFIFLILALAVNEVQQVSKLFNIMLTKRIIPSNSTIFAFVKFGNNHSNVFIYLALAIFGIMAVILCARSMHVNEPYNNPAQHRKIKAKWRNIRRWSATSFILIVCTVLLMTIIETIVTAETQLSPTEESTISGDNIIVTYDQVSDGHLHRFGYTTENGTEIRFIVIQKPNSTTYGVGMDACDICGQTGYYENGNGEVVCNRCDVVMNINTIGFQGGCNPKVFDYTVENQQIIIPIESLTQYEDDFD